MKPQMVIAGLQMLLPSLTVLLAASSICLAVTKPTMVMVPMRDGVKLATDIYLPADTGQFPVLLSRTPYARTVPPQDIEERMTGGFVLVVQNVRGKFESEGGDVMSSTTDGWGELQDGYDTVEWIAKQPWCNGKIGTYGASANGITQYLLAGAAPPHLVAQVVDVATGDLYHHLIFPGGVGRSFGGDARANEPRRSGYEGLAAHAAYGKFWHTMDLSTRYDKVNVPIMHTGGWYDIFLQGTIDAFVGIQYHGAEGARGRQRLIIGPWTHAGNIKAGKYEYPNGKFKKWDTANLWLAYWLKGTGDKSITGPPILYYTMGALGEKNAPGNEWRTSEVWPIAHKDTPFYLRAGGRLSTSAPEDLYASSGYRFDPDNPVPSVAGRALPEPAGSADQTPIENRKDVLLFSSDTLTEPLEVTGRIKVRLWASASTKDTDFTAKLTDVYPDGRSMLVCDGIVRARYRDRFDSPRLLKPGKSYEFEIDLWSTSLIFNKGHKIRLAISSSNSPRYGVNPNTGEPVLRETHKVPSDVTIYFDASHPSRVILPVVRQVER